MTMLERAARAAALELRRQEGYYTNPEAEIDNSLQLTFMDLSHVDCASLARAVLRAIREPSEAMLNAGADQLFDSRYEDPTEDALEIYQAMIDAA